MCETMQKAGGKNDIYVDNQWHRCAVPIICKMNFQYKYGKLKIILKGGTTKVNFVSKKILLKSRDTNHIFRSNLS